MANETKHTPGPWEAHNGEVTTRQINGRSYRRIAAIQDYGVGCLPEVDKANARLIAAAPDLLDAAEGVVGDLERFVSHRGPGPDQRLALLRAAIAKAKGA